MVSTPCAEAAPFEVGLGHEIANKRIADAVPDAGKEDNEADVRSLDLPWLSAAPQSRHMHACAVSSRKAEA